MTKKAKHRTSAAVAQARRLKAVQRLVARQKKQIAALQSRIRVKERKAQKRERTIERKAEKRIRKINIKAARKQEKLFNIIGKRAYEYRKSLPPPLPPRLTGEGLPPIPRPSALKPFETLTLAKQAKGFRTKTLTLVIRTSYYRPEAKDIGKRIQIKESHKKGTLIYTRTIRKGNITIRTENHYIRIKREQLASGVVEGIVEKLVRDKLPPFEKSSYNSFTSSVQLIRGQIVNPFTKRIAANAKVSKAAYFPAYSKKVKTSPKKRRADELDIIKENNITTMLAMLYNVYEYGFARRWSARETREYRKHKPDRQAKLAGTATQGEEG